MSKQRIFYLVADCGDGSATVQFFMDGDRAQALLDEDPDTYALNEDLEHFDIEGEHNIRIQHGGC